MRLYILPMPLSRESSYWMYPYWGEVVQGLDYFFVERCVRVRPWLQRAGLRSEAQLFEYNADYGDWDMEAYHQVFSSRAPAALLSEVGLAGVADPGYTVVRRAHAEGYTVVPLAGPSSITLALSASGLEGQRFTFWGYPPLEKKSRYRFLREVLKQAHFSTQILMETPARNNLLLEELLNQAPPELYLCIAHHLTALDGFIQTKPVGLWKPTKLPKAPTLFLLGR
ncbi:MAG: SAM-dependent methyltransferase [Bacteroidia bacterium]|nr:SAM-dependent methyltransferase [Bacteroidia bacterium]MDW8014415.1 SAM-dependent methyltransferase [Bacteroidia bacterium]